VRPIGFSTGALAKGDYQEGLRLQLEVGVSAVELSALRENEVEILVAALSDLDLSKLQYVSFHAPSKLSEMSEDQLLGCLNEVARREIPIVVHPDIIQNPDTWRSLGRWLLIENMDQRKPVGRTAGELRPFFNLLPEARFCFDIGHARQVDPTMGVAVEMLIEFRDRLAEIHLSEVRSDSRHVAIGETAAAAYRHVASLIPETTPVILESMVAPEQIRHELEVAQSCLSSCQQDRDGHLAVS